MVYHKDLDPDYIDTTIQPMIVPQLICDAVKDQMDDVDKALSVLSAQRALENLLIASTSLIRLPGHLHYIGLFSAVGCMRCAVKSYISIMMSFINTYLSPV